MALGANSLALSAYSSELTVDNDGSGNSASALYGGAAWPGREGTDHSDNHAFADGVGSMAVADDRWPVALAGADGDNNTDNTAYTAGLGR